MIAAARMRAHEIAIKRYFYAFNENTNKNVTVKKYHLGWVCTFALFICLRVHRFSSFPGVTAAIIAHAL